jgi:hypothetical protein
MAGIHVIWKHGFALKGGEQRVFMPEGAMPVHFAMQHDIPTMWFRCNPTATPVERRFFIQGTGHHFAMDLTHVGTCQHGEFVWHLLEAR